MSIVRTTLHSSSDFLFFKLEEQLGIFLQRVYIHLFFFNIYFNLQFFVASDPTVKTDRLWHDKYTLRKSMIPSFITMEQSKKV